MKLLVLALFVAIVASLGSGLYYLTKDNQGSPRVLMALKIRVALSALLILFLLVAYFAGWMEPANTMSEIPAGPGPSGCD